MTPTGVILCDDLIFTSKVSGTARAHGLAVVPAKTVEAALTHSKIVQASVVLIDLQHAGLDLGSFLTALRALDPVPRIVAFGSHVDVKSLKAARAAGCDFVMPRSQFVAHLETDLPTWFAGEATPAE